MTTRKLRDAADGDTGHVRDEATTKNSSFLGRLL
jgi:hypothetical protein